MKIKYDRDEQMHAMCRETYVKLVVERGISTTESLELAMKFAAAWCDHLEKMASKWFQ